MTMQPLLRPPLTPPPRDILRLFTYCLGKLNQRSKDRAEKALERAADEATRRVKLRLKAMDEASGLEEGPPALRRDWYTQKSRMEAQYGLWYGQRQEFPEDYRKRAIDAFELGSLLPAWVEADAIAFGARIK